MANKSLRQLGQLSLSVLISAPLAYGSHWFLTEQFEERLWPWWSITGCIGFWSLLAAAVCTHLFEHQQLNQKLLKIASLGFLTICVNFLLIVGAMFVWLAFFFTS